MYSQIILSCRPGGKLRAAVQMAAPTKDQGSPLAALVRSATQPGKPVKGKLSEIKNAAAAAREKAAAAAKDKAEPTLREHPSPFGHP